jgi:hypothetical protein
LTALRHEERGKGRRDVHREMRELERKRKTFRYGNRNRSWRKGYTYSERIWLWHTETGREENGRERVTWREKEREGRRDEGTYGYNKRKKARGRNGWMWL